MPEVIRHLSAGAGLRIRGTTFTIHSHHTFVIRKLYFHHYIIQVHCLYWRRCSIIVTIYSPICFHTIAWSSNDSRVSIEDQMQEPSASARTSANLFEMTHTPYFLAFQLLIKHNVKSALYLTHCRVAFELNYSGAVNVLTMVYIRVVNIAL